MPCVNPLVNTIGIVGAQTTFPAARQFAYHPHSADITMVQIAPKLCLQIAGVLSKRLRTCAIRAQQCRRGKITDQLIDLRMQRQAIKTASGSW